MRALVYSGPLDVRLAQVPDPSIISPSDAIVEVTHAAICGTDLHAYRGHVNSIPPGTILGHEFVGRIVEVGSAVEAHKVGDLVFGADFTACGRCWWCRRLEYFQCDKRQVFGYGAAFGEPLPGAQAEYVRVPFADVVLAPAPAECPVEVGIFTGDTLATGYTAADEGGVSPGDIVAVIGGGAVGQMVSLACQAFGAAVVVLSDLIVERRELAAELGAVAVSPHDTRRTLDALTAGRGADVVIEAVGGAGPLSAAFELVRPHGRIVSVGAHFAPTWPLPVGDCFAKELSISFRLGDPHRVRDPLLALTTAGVIDPTVIVSERVDLDEAPEAYRRFEGAATIKPLITIQGAA